MFNLFVGNREKLESWHAAGQGWVVVGEFAVLRPHSLLSCYTVAEEMLEPPEDDIRALWCPRDLMAAARIKTGMHLLPALYTSWVVSAYHVSILLEEMYSPCTFRQTKLAITFHVFLLLWEVGE